MTAARIQRQRTRGWRMPAGAVYVGRPSKWGNPYDWRSFLTADGERAAKAGAARWFADAIRSGELVLPMHELRGKVLACWCRRDEPCHGDVLLRLANRRCDAEAAP